MAYLKIDIPALTEFKKLFKTNPSLSSVVPDVSVAILKVNATIEQRQKALYSTPGTVSSVFLGKSVKPEALGKTFLTYGLQYKEVPIPLRDYSAALLSGAIVPSKAPLRIGGENSLGYVVWTPGDWRYGRELRLQLREDKRPRLVRRSKRSKFKGFLQKNGKVYVRTTSKTWKTYPSKGVKGIRNPIVEVYGPSLASVAVTLATYDPVVQKSIEDVADQVVKSMTKAYD